MKPFHFSKMHGLGNDFIVINAMEDHIDLSPDTLRTIADRHTGIGCDQVLVLGKSTSTADFSYRIYNNDGSTASHCGNGARCIARFVRDKGLSSKADLTFDMGSFLIHTHYKNEDSISVEMGTASTGVPFELNIQGHTFTINPVAMANPHAIIFTAIATQTLIAVGELLNQHNQFPDGVNVSAVYIKGKHAIDLNVYERGAGITQACGSAACAAVFAAMEAGYVESPCQVQMPGGICEVSVSDQTTGIVLTGPAAHVFDGVWYAKP